MEQLKRAESPYRFLIPEDLIPKLRSIRAQQKDWREVIDAEDVFRLCYGLGPDCFLAFDGRILVDNDDWDGTGAYEVSMKDSKYAWLIVVYAANRLCLPELLRILPARPRMQSIALNVAGLVGYIYHRLWASKDWFARKAAVAWVGFLHLFLKSGSD